MSTAYKKMTSHGSISIPVAMRRELGIEPKDPMIVEEHQGEIRIKPYTLRCNFCGTTEDVHEFHGKDDMMKLDRVTIKASFVDCEPQDVIRYVLACAGIEDYVLSDEHYGKKDLFVIDRKSGINTIAEVNSSWGIKNPFFFQKKVFYWGTKEEQKEIYVLEEGETILSLNKYGDLWEAETIAIPWIHHSQEVEVQHSKYSGIVTVEKTIVRSDDTGAVHMYIYFAGGEKDV